MKKDLLSSIKGFFGGFDRSFVASLIAIACTLVCVVLCINCLTSVSAVTKGIETVVTEVQEMKQTNAELTQRITKLETAVDNTQYYLNESAASRYIKITKQPSSVSTYIGRTDAMLFSVVAEGNGLRFTWQKYNDSKGDWDELVFDGNGFNDELGIRLYNDQSNGTSELWTKDFKSTSFGTYRCLISDEQGTQVYSDSILIQEKAAP